MMVTLAQKIHREFISNGWTLSLAESCTGGGISTQLVDIPNASLYFLGSIVAYADAAKTKILGVDMQTLETFGAVSEEVAIEMALGAITQFDSDYALSVTGIAGPTGGNGKKPVGTVCFAIAQKQGEAFSWKEHFEGLRAKIIEQSIVSALEHLEQAAV